MFVFFPKQSSITEQQTTENRPHTANQLTYIHLIKLLCVCLQFIVRWEGGVGEGEGGEERGGRELVMENGGDGCQ